MAIAELARSGGWSDGAGRRGPGSANGLRGLVGPRRPAELEDAAGAWTARWLAWGTTASVTVTDAGLLPAARKLVAREFAAAEKAAARFRPDAEIHKLYRAAGRSLTVSPLLADLISGALVAAERTNGDVDPTVGAAMTATYEAQRPGRRTGRRGTRAAVPVCGSRAVSPGAAARPVPGWEQVSLFGRRVQVPTGTTLDLSATAKAVTCDRAAALVRERLDVGVLVTLGGDAASAGPAPDDGWYLPVEDRTGSLDTALRLPAGAAAATSHFTSRPRAGEPETGGLLGHLIDPRTGRPPAPVWRMATAIGFSSLEAATYTSAALVRGTSARNWLTQLWVPARLVTAYDDEIEIGPWAAHTGVRAEELASTTPSRTDPRRTPRT